MQALFLRDMAYRRLRVLLTVLGIAVLATLILLFGGIMNGLRWQARRYVSFTGADLWLSRERSGGVFVGFTLLNPEYIEPAVRGSAGGHLDPDKDISPLIFAHARPVIRRNGLEHEVKAVVVGYRLGRLGGPAAKDLLRGRLFVPSPEVYSPEQQPPMEAVVDESLGLEIGESLDIGGHEIQVVGLVRKMMFVFDTPLVFVDVRTAQKAVLADVIYVNTFLAKLKPDESPSEVAAALNDANRGIRTTLAVETATSGETIGSILKNFVDEPMKGVQFLRVMLWLAAGLIVGMITYVTTMEKTQEVGVMKAIGATNRYVFRLILNQVVLMSVAGVVLGVVLALAAVPAFPIFVLLNPIEATIISLLSVLVCIGGGVFAALRALRVDPMVAFRGEL
ncbi:ABC transporter permease [Candidatus Poribacteria bacterium]|nr:ABC transporter permease [Candidatus Poribacteria bacterium]